MPGPFVDLPFLFAQAAKGGDSGFGPTLIMLAPVVLLFYLMIMRPQQQQEKRRREMIDRLKKNDKVLTHAGIYGTVVSVDAEADRVVVRIDDEKNVRVAFSKTGISRVVDPTAEKDKDKDKVTEPA